MSIHPHASRYYFYNNGKIYDGTGRFIVVEDLQKFLHNEGEAIPIMFYKNILIFKTSTHIIIFDTVSRKHVITDDMECLPSHCFGEYMLFDSGAVRPISKYLAETVPDGSIKLDERPIVALGELKFI